MDTLTPAVDMAAIRADHGMVQARAESTAYATARLSFGESYLQGHRTAWWAAVEWVLSTQSAMESLTAGEMLAEIRKGTASIYWPLLEADPKFWADCPGCDRRTLLDAEGVCGTCGHSFEGEK